MMPTLFGRLKDLWTHRSYLLTAIARACKWVAAVVGSNVEELAVGVALALIVMGLRQVWLPGAYIAPGLVLLWIFLPARTSFIATKDEKKGRT